MPMFDPLFMVTLVPSVGLWSASIGISNIPYFNAEKRAFIRKLATISSSFSFGVLFAVFGWLSLTGSLQWFFIFIGVLVIVYSFVVYNSFEKATP